MFGGIAVIVNSVGDYMIEKNIGYYTRESYVAALVDIGYLVQKTLCWLTGF